MVKELEDFLRQKLLIGIETQFQNNNSKALPSKDLKNLLFRKLTSKKFRKKKLHPETLIRTKNAIDCSVDHNNSLKLVLPMGGYKLWKFETSPEIDWAEFFNVSYLIPHHSFSE